jgi:putative ABC transport system permease protein
MWKNYFKIAYRSLLKYKGYTFINLIGLAVGMACCLLIGFYVQDELSYDRYHQNADRIYRVLHAFRSGGDAQNISPLTPEEYQVWGNAPVGPALAAEFPEIQKMVQFDSPSNLLFQFGDKRFQEDNVIHMDANAFELFNWKLLAGNPEKALVAPNSLVLTESTARKYFGDSNPLGQTIMVDNETPYTVTGVMEDVPANSQFTFDVLRSMSRFQQNRPEIFDHWGYVDFYTYFLLQEGADIASLQAKTPQFLKRHGQERNYNLTFEPMTEAYLHSKATRQPGTTGSLTNIYIFSSIAVFILLIACINFMNLATARSVERAKEVGVRKVIGANQAGLIYQFLTESTILSLLAAVLALLLAGLSFPAMQQLSGKAFSYELLYSWQVLLTVFGAAIVVGILAGSYPAWALARFRPALVLKGVFKSSSSGIALRKGLVVFQFSLSMALIAGTAIVFSQLNYLRTKDLGFRQEQMLVIDFGNDYAIGSEIETVKTVLTNHPDVLSASASRAVPGDFLPNAHTEIQSPQGNMKSDGPLLYEIDYDFISHFDMEMAAGRAFSRDFPADTAESLIINEAAAKLYGFHQPANAVGQRFSQWGREGTIIGVVKDFNFRSLHNEIEPLALRFAPPYELTRLSLRVTSDDMQATIAELEKLWGEIAPQRPFLYSFLDESFNQQYQADLRFGQVFSVFAGMAIFIACLGLFGLATYTAQQRTKEIGIRKVLGASVTSIVSLLSKDFLKLVLVAAIIAFPVGWYAMHQWLQDFPYRIDIPLWVFLAAGVIATLIAFLTISLQAVKAATTNPVKNLRTE